MTEPSQAHIDRARELGLSFDPSDTSDEELSRAIATYERVYIESMSEKRSVEPTDRRRLFGPDSIDDVRNPG
ncbi:hypothetical protein PROPHIGD91-2_64 [Mycobacterium phage prophiGD91-2]|nr:hypothetical protein PROPHIGD91-2_64 [Mycobacterium phage prophiGD91-2]SIJ01694.1 Uncharacterised protein [Mycobacteroides abscessus subsp. bolletii]SLD36914.1 Uncharacterised protein [Mycobacteroides abscessus subsp. bolletii]